MLHNSSCHTHSPLCVSPFCVMRHFAHVNSFVKLKRYLKQVYVVHQFSFFYILSRNELKVGCMGFELRNWFLSDGTWYSIVDGRGVAYGLIFRPSGVSERSVLSNGFPSVFYSWHHFCGSSQ